MYRLSNKADSDLGSILDYSIVNFGADIMLKYHQSLETCFETLDENPDLGTEVDYLRSDYLCFEYRSHLMFYKKIHQDILIIRILHKSMNAPEHFN